MDWSEICHYIAICIFLGPDYQIYMCISVFRHLQQDILKHTEAQDLQVFLKVRVSFLIFQLPKGSKALNTENTYVT